MVINPWGEVLAAATDDEPQVLRASLDLTEVAKARAAIPNLVNERAFAGPEVVA
jgi:predicted amidohydrolase